MEIWKDIKGYESLYQISNLGRVKRLGKNIKYSNGVVCFHKERILKFDMFKMNKRGKFYLRVTLSKDNKQKRIQVHRLVAKHFIENLENKKCVNHIDGNPENNKVKNLEWCSYSENERHSYDILGKINNNRKLEIKDVEYILYKYVKGRNGNIKELAKEFDVDKKTIYNVINKKYYV